MTGLKILIVTGIFPPDHGGPASYVPAIATALAHNHTILGVMTLSESLEQDDSIYPFPVVRILRRRNRLLRQLLTILKITRLALNADVVYLNGLFLEGVLACKISNKPVVIKVVGDLIWEKLRGKGITGETLDTFQTETHGITTEALKKLQYWYINQANLVITPSYYLAKIVQGWGIPEEKIKVIHNSVYGLPTINTETQTASADCVTVARIEPWKGIAELIQIAIQNQWSLHVVGEGSLRQSLENQVQENKANHLIKFIGAVPKSQVFTEIAKAKVFILNSSYEGLPHIVLEAKAVGVPVIATAIGGTPETITDGVNGFLVTLGDLDELTQKIRFLLNHPEERQRIGMAGYQQVKTNYSFDAMLQETEKTLKSVCIKAKTSDIKL
jgi:glycosyltransferase involved in cell wall biosynthesis